MSSAKNLPLVAGAALCRLGTAEKNGSAIATLFIDTAMADNTPKPEETKATTETKVEETKVTEEKKAEESKPEPKPASAASTTDETPDVNLSSEYKSLEENEEVLYSVYVFRATDGRTSPNRPFIAWPTFFASCALVSP